MGQQIQTRYHVAFPRLYHSLPQSVRITPYHTPNVHIHTDDLDLCTFYFDQNSLGFRHFSPVIGEKSPDGAQPGILRSVVGTCWNLTQLACQL